MPSYSILIVEDENITAMELQERLKSWNYHVAAIVSSGTQAVQKAAELRPDLILMDIILKGELDGIDTAEQIHATGLELFGEDAAVLFQFTAQVEPFIAVDQLKCCQCRGRNSRRQAG